MNFKHFHSNKKQQYLAIKATGKDKPGITAALTRILANAGAVLIDVEQATLQDLLALSFLVDIEAEEGSKEILKDLLFEAKELGITLDFQILNSEDLKSWDSTILYALTCLGDTSKAEMLSALSSVLAQSNANILTIRSLARKSFSAIELMIDVSKVTSMSKMRETLLAVSSQIGFDMALQREDIYRRSKRLVVFDMDSTLIEGELIVELAHAAGVAEEVHRVTERAMRGEIDFEDSLKQRVALLKGLAVEQIETVISNMKLSHGVAELISLLKRLGFKVAVISGGFDILTNKLTDQLKLDYAFANRLEIKNGQLTGRLQGDIVDDLQKAKLIQQIARKEQTFLDQVIAIGDGANDILMLGQAGLGIAYNAKEVLKRVADANIAFQRMLNILYLIGITEQDIEMLTKESTQKAGA